MLAKTRAINLVLICAFSALMYCCAGSRSNESKIIRIKGSDTMFILIQRWAEIFMAENSGTAIYTEGGGTAEGVKTLIAGKAEICTASRLLRSEEASSLAATHSTLGISFLVAKDALSIYLHPSNPVKDLTLKQLKEIFSGKITNWAAVGGNDESIIVITRPPNSGTYVYFKDRILEGESYSSSAESRPTTNTVVETISQNPNAIGYGGIAYGLDLMHSKINGISPSEESVRFDLYPITRYLYLYTINKPRGITKKFIDWILSPQGQRIVKSIGYIPLWPIPARL